MDEKCALRAIDGRVSDCRRFCAGERLIVQQRSIENKRVRQNIQFKTDIFRNSQQDSRMT